MKTITKIYPNPSTGSFKVITPSTDPGDYSVEANGSLILKAGGEINLKPGVHFKLGAIVHIVPEYEICNDYRNMQQNNGSEANATDEYRTNLSDAQVLHLATVYPNPSVGSFIIEVSINNTLLGIAMYDLAGLSKYEVQTAETQKITVAPNLPSGIYLLRITTTLGTETHKILLQ